MYTINNTHSGWYLSFRSGFCSPYFTMWFTCRCFQALLGVSLLAPAQVHKHTRWPSRQLTILSFFEKTSKNPLCVVFLVWHVAVLNWYLLVSYYHSLSTRWEIPPERHGNTQKNSSSPAHSSPPQRNSWRWSAAEVPRTSPSAAPAHRRVKGPRLVMGLPQASIGWFLSGKIPLRWMISWKIPTKMDDFGGTPYGIGNLHVLIRIWSHDMGNVVIIGNLDIDVST